MRKKIIVLLLIAIVIYIVYINNYNSIKKNDNIELVIKNQWALMNNGQSIKGVLGQIGCDINATEAWKITKGNEKVIVGILDTGIDISNSKISKNIFINKNEIPNNRKDDDGNGCVDDVNGWDFYNNDNSVYDDSLSDYHGTLVASIIAASHDNGEVWGIAPGVTILPLKFMRGSSGSIDDAIKAIKYAYSMGARIINCSWDDTAYNNELYNVMKRYKDILFICSSGKTQNNLKELPVFPACFDLENVVCTGAVDNNGQKYELSGYGIDKEVFAPGKDILSILPEGDATYVSGTSYSTAYVTGIAALVKSYNINISAEDLGKILRRSKKFTKAVSDQANFVEIIDAKLCLKYLLENH